MERIEKLLSDLDTSKVNFEDGHWSYGRGGHPLHDCEWAISHTSDEYVETRYKLPDCLNVMMEAQYRHGGEDARGQIRHALGV